MNSNCNRAFLLATAGALAASSASAQIISDDFEVNSAADYTIVDDGTPDGTQTFAYDYITAGIPLAPRSAAGDTGGLLLTANDTAGAVDAWTLFHNTPVNADSYTLTVDVWMNFAALSGSTEYSHIGVGGDGATFNSLFSPISGSGAFIAFTGDGGATSDYRWFRDGANTPTNETGSTTLPNDHYSYLGHGSNASGAYFQALFPSPPSTIAGSPGNIWTTLEIEVDNIAGLISFRFDGSLCFQGNFANSFNGFASLGIADVFTSVSGASNVFSLYDNLDVSVTDPTAVGTAYCTPAVTNSTGMGGEITATGSEYVSVSNLTLTATNLPNNEFGYFLNSMTQDFVFPVLGSQGALCLGGQIGRYNASVFNTGAAGTGSLVLDLANTPTPTGTVSIAAGETWNWSCWFRDNNPGPTSNFTDGVSVVFL